MTFALRNEPYAGQDPAERDLVMFTYLREVRKQRRRLALETAAALAMRTRLYSEWDEPAPAHDHAPRQSDGWPLVVCKEGSD